MNERINNLLRLTNAVKNDELDVQLQILDTITQGLFNITQSLFDNKVKPTYHLKELENKFFRFGIANQSIINLQKGNNFQLNSKEVKMVDIFSSSSIVRMQIECFTLMHYLFFDEVNVEEKEFRYNLYMLHGLQKQSKFKANSEWALLKKQKIEDDIKLITNKIVKSELYIKADLKEKKDFLTPRKPKLKTTLETLKAIDLIKRNIDDIWNLYSNHAHGEYISDRQFNTIYRINKSTKKEFTVSFSSLSILTAFLIDYLTKEFNFAREALKLQDQQTKDYIEFFISLGKGND